MWAAFRPDRVWRLGPVLDMEEVSRSTIVLAYYIFSLGSMLGPLVHDGRLLSWERMFQKPNVLC